jgi:LacI family transcriptional regulator
MTVSCILNDKAHLFRPETCDKVRKTAARLGYRRNSVARAMRQGRFNSVALVTSDVYHKSTLTPGYLSGIHSVLGPGNQHLVVSQLPDKMFVDDEYLPEILREAMVDGLLLYYIQEIPPHMVELLEQCRLPAVWMNVRKEANCVHPDDLDAGRMVTRHLIELGHRRIAYVDGVHVFDPNHERQDHYSAADRYEGYCQVMREAGLTPRMLSQRVNLPTSRIAELMAGWLSEPQRPTALLTYGDRETQATLLASAWVGLRVPQDLSIVTFSPEPLDVGRPITTALIPTRKVGTEATRMLLDNIATPGQVSPARALPFTLTSPLSSIPLSLS